MQLNNNYNYRFYRDFKRDDNRFLKYNILYNESDLNILLPSDINNKVLEKLKIKINRTLVKTYETINNYCRLNFNFFESLIPVEIMKTDPQIIKSMKKNTILANVGPMASVAGEVAYRVLKEILSFKFNNFCVKEAIVENGGDIALYVERPVKILMYSGSKYFKKQIGFRFCKTKKIYGISTSSGKIGHSKSSGNADSITVISKSPQISDAFATSIGNMIRNEKDFEKLKSIRLKDKNIEGIIVIFNDKIFLKGDIKLIFSKD